MCFRRSRYTPNPRESSSNFSPELPSGLLDHASILSDVPLFATYAALTYSKIQNPEAGISMVKLARSESKLFLDLFQHRCPCNKDVLAPTGKPQWPSQISSAHAENFAHVTDFRCNCAGIVQVRKSKLYFSILQGVLNTTRMTLTLHNDVSRQDGRRQALPPSQPN